MNAAHYLELDEAKLILDLAAAIRQAMGRPQAGRTDHKCANRPDNSWAGAS
jgi:hypothetical protein